MYRTWVDLDFCLSPADQQGLVVDSPEDPIEFANEVFPLEGLSIEEAPVRLYRQLGDCVAEAFRQAAALDDSSE